MCQRMNFHVPKNEFRRCYSICQKYSPSSALISFSKDWLLRQMLFSVAHLSIENPTQPDRAKSKITLFLICCLFYLNQHLFASPSGCTVSLVLMKSFEFYFLKARSSFLVSYPFSSSAYLPFWHILN